MGDGTEDEQLANSETGISTRGGNNCPTVKRESSQIVGESRYRKHSFTRERINPTVKRNERGEACPTVKRVGRRENTMRSMPPSLLSYQVIHLLHTRYTPRLYTCYTPGTHPACLPTVIHRYTPSMPPYCYSPLYTPSMSPYQAIHRYIHQHASLPGYNPGIHHPACLPTYIPGYTTLCICLPS